jgi:hypothetical protein
MTGRTCAQEVHAKMRVTVAGRITPAAVKRGPGAIVKLLLVCVVAHGSVVSSMGDCLKCQTAAASPAEPGGASLGRLVIRRIRKCVLDHVADRLPGAAIELNQSHLPDGSVIVRACVDLDARQ